jgi:hypothetical protein
MDPYLEDPAFWEGFHDVFVTECMYAVEQRLPMGYISDLRERAHTISIEDEAAELYIPDVAVARQRIKRRKQRLVEEASQSNTDANGGLAVQARPVTIPMADETIDIREDYLEILKLPDRELVTAIELLSPWNKLGNGVSEYRNKRNALIHRGVHMVELDLLRRGRRTELAGPLPRGDYYAMVFRTDRRPDVDVYGWSLRNPLPTVAIPLRAPDADITLDLAAVVGTAYDRGRYDRKLRYGKPIPPPPVSTDDAKWADGLLRAAGLFEAD